MTILKTCICASLALIATGAASAQGLATKMSIYRAAESRVVTQGAFASIAMRPVPPGQRLYVADGVCHVMIANGDAIGRVSLAANGRDDAPSLGEISATSPGVYRVRVPAGFMLSANEAPVFRIALDRDARNATILGCSLMGALEPEGE